MCGIWCIGGETIWRGSFCIELRIGGGGGKRDQSEEPAVELLRRNQFNCFGTNGPKNFGNFGAFENTSIMAVRRHNRGT